MRIKLSKVLNDLNVGLQTIQDFLTKKKIDVDTSNPNTRIEEDLYHILVKEFKPDMEQKILSDSFTNERQKAKIAADAAKEDTKRNVEEIKIEVNKPKVVGKIDLSNPGKPVIVEETDTPQTEATALDEVAPDTAAPQTDATPVAPAHDEIKQEAEPAIVEELQATHDKEEVTTDAPQPVVPEPQLEQEPAPQETPQEKEETPEPQPEQEPAQQEAPQEKAEEAPADENTDKKEPEIFTTGTPVLKNTINVVGKIDLAAINQSTRPKKKSKEERRKERIDKEKARATEGKKKRKRIGKEKVDIEKSAAQIPAQPAPKKNAAPATETSAKKKDKKKRPFKAEVNDEDVQRQVKETLARLTTKVQKKSAKWRKEKRDAVREEIAEQAAEQAAEQRTLKLTEFVTANDLAAMMNVPVNKVIGTCMNLGVMVSINQRLDAETINIVAEEFGFKTEYESADVAEAIHEEEDAPEDLEARPPVVTVMGHVDHGKTSLLDYIRKSNVIAGEAGGITQHIGAYNVKLPNGRRITFLDTPGHEAFTAMRARGAKVTDIVIVIVAADDNVMPQTVEALNHASAAGVPIVFAINKIDKDGANPDKIKEELANMNYLVEEWGGKYQSQDISAKKGIGVEELMDKVILEADLLDLKANPNRKATGSIIESSLDKGRGYVATVLVDNGTLHVGDIVLAGTHYGKVKAMFNERNQRIKEAGPSSPALILGLNGAPTAGDKFNVMDTDQEARQIANKREQLQRELGLRTQKRVTLEDIGRRRALGDFHELNIIVKGDVDGSIEALSDSLIKLSTPEVQVNVIHKAVGAISESDVTLAAASDAYIVGFQVRPSVDAKRLAAQEGVDIRIYSIIYDAIEEVKSAMEGMLSPDIKEEVIGSAEVKEVYHISKVGTIAGALVREGKLRRPCRVRVIRDGIVIFTGNLGSLKRFKDDAKEVATGFECGFSIQSYNDLQVGDIVEAFEEIEVAKTL